MPFGESPQAGDKQSSQTITTMPDQVKDKNGNTIEKGDYVFTKIRGGKREGEVEEIVVTQEEAKKENVKNPPKVIFHDQHGHKVAHNPEALEDLDAEE